MSPVAGGGWWDPGDLSLAERIIELALGRRATLATAESLTGGLLGAALTAVPGSSQVYRGGVIAYATDVKATLLGVDEQLLTRAGPVDADVARAMAEGAARRFAATYAVATTGVAGPGPQAGLPPGRVHVAVAHPRGTDHRRLDLIGDRPVVRAATVVAALRLLDAALARNGGSITLLQ